MSGLGEAKGAFQETETDSKYLQQTFTEPFAWVQKIQRQIAHSPVLKELKDR